MVRACVVPGCKSGSEVPSHCFPKNPTRSREWLRVVQSPRLSGLNSEELRKYCVCHLHFPVEAYIYTLNRRRLKQDVIPSLNLPNMEPIDPPGTSNMQIDPEPRPISMQSDPEPRLISMQIDPEPVIHMNPEPVIHMNPEPVIQTEPAAGPSHQKMQIKSEPGPSHQQMPMELAELGQSSLQTDLKPSSSYTHTDSELQSTPKRRRSLLGHDTRHENLTPKAKRLYKVAKGLKKEKHAMTKKIAGYKQRLKDATKFANSKYFETLTSSFSRTQKLFFDMQLRNSKYRPKVELRKFRNNIRKICPKYAHQYLKNC